MSWVVKIKHKVTGSVALEMKAATERQAERALRGAYINLNQEDYELDIYEDRQS